MADKDVAKVTHDGQANPAEKPASMSNQEFEDAAEAFRFGTELFAKGQYEAAVEKWLPVAESGHGEAQYHIGMCYYDGKGVQQDYEKAVEWLKKVNSISEGRAKLVLGDCYRYGRGVAKDISLAMDYYADAYALGGWRFDNQPDGLEGKKILEELAKQGVEGAKEKLKQAEQKRKENKKQLKKIKKEVAARHRKAMRDGTGVFIEE